MDRNIRLLNEGIEKAVLSRYATYSSGSLGREKAEEECDIRTCFARDRDRILHSKSFRRLKHKTQVFLAPEGDHFRTRLTHTLEVAQISVTIAKALRLNQELTQAIAYGHDLGHTPFGHSGEDVLNKICSLGFTHYEQSVRVCKFLEKNGEGLNLTKEVLDGIYNHRTAGSPMTQEGKIVRLSDKIAYINHDIDDSIRAGIFSEENLPKEIINVLGKSVKERLNTLVHDVIENSFDEPDIIMSKEIYDAMMDLRKWMFKNVYTNGLAKTEEGRAKGIVKMLYEYFLDNIDFMPKEYIHYIYDLNQPKERIVCDYIAGMTDTYAIKKFMEIFVPKSFSV